MTDQLQVASKSEVVIKRLSGALETHGFRVYRSFDLRNALAALPDCGCPHHGTGRCTCQYTVLLVYGRLPAPVLVVVHGRDDSTWLTLPAANGPAETVRQQVQGIVTATLLGKEEERSSTTT